MSRDADWFDNEDEALRRCWHPVAEVEALDGDGPHPVRLLGDDYASSGPTADPGH